MDFARSQAEEAFRTRVREWLRANLPDGWGTSAYPKPRSPAERVAFARQWQCRLYSGGWAGLSWPREYGGQALSPLEQPSVPTSTSTATATSTPTGDDFTFSQTWADITTRQLLSMSSGIEDFGSNTLPWYQILTNVGRVPLVFSPGTNYCYSNPGFMTVGAIIQQLTTLAYSDYMQQYVFGPLNMPETVIHTPENAPSNLATGYTYDSTTMSWTVPASRSPLSSFSAGAIISTAVDLGTFISALQNRALLSPATYQLMWTDVTLQSPTRPSAWGLGWEVTLVGPYQIYRKDGALPGISAQLSLYDSGSTQIGVAIASNESMATGLVTLTADIVSAVLGTPVPNPPGPGDGCTPTPCFNCPTETPPPLPTPTPG